VAIADLYVEGFSAPPWNEIWTRESALEELARAAQKDCFVGVFAYEPEIEDIAGFSWGYKLPTKRQGRVDFETSCANLLQKGISPSQVFYGADTVVREKFRGQGLAKKLVYARTGDCPERYVCFRTKNEPMLKAYRSVFGKEITSFVENSAYDGGRMYVFRTSFPIADLHVPDPLFSGCLR